MINLEVNIVLQFKIIGYFLAEYFKEFVYDFGKYKRAIFEMNTSNDLFRLNIGSSVSGDRGVYLALSILGFGVSLEIYDKRFWNSVTQEWWT
jgi:hypothetical protein